MSKEYLNSLKKRKDYNKENQLYLKKRVFLTFHNLAQTFYKKDIMQFKNMLDLGTADGALVEISKKYGLNSVGIDANDMNFENDKFNFRDNQFDLVTAVSLIEHINNPKILLNETRRILNDNGIFILVTPDWEHSYKNFYDDPTHVRPYTRKSISSLLKSFKFRDVLVVPWLVCKPQWMWKIPFSFFLARNIPFIGNKNLITRKFIPNFLKGKSETLLIICKK